MSTAPKIAPYGSWKSPISSSLIVSQSIGLPEVRLDGEDIYWLETRPQERGRNVIVRASTGSAGPLEVIPQTFNARTRVHEYGGGSWTVCDGTVYFSNFSDGRLYRQKYGEDSPQAITPAPSIPERGWRYADGIIDVRRQRWIGVREDHTGSERYPINSVVTIALEQPGSDAGQIVADGHDFFSSPRLSPDGKWLMWLAWDFPNMPWNGTTLFLTELGENGAPLGEPRAIAGGRSESIFQPEWSPDGSAIWFVSDSSGWWNLYRWQLDDARAYAVAPMAAEFGQPQWVFGMSTYAFAGPERVVCTYTRAGLGQMALLNVASNQISELSTPFTEFASVQASGDRIVFRGGAPTRPACIACLDLRSGDVRVLKKSTELLDNAALRIADYLTKVQAVEFPTGERKIAYGLYYPPHNPDYQGLKSEKPPLVVRCHGGPTSAASTTLSLGIQYWTSRGIAVLDVNYGGSTGFGRDYRERLHRSWGVVDVEDCANGAKFLAEQGWVDGERAVITGGSAGGYTALAALAFTRQFYGGASHYGVSDTAVLAKDTHKFEARYLDWLIGPYPQEEALYRQRSPLAHADRILVPVIFFQGDEDAIVPPNQTELMVDALRANGIAVGYLLFSGEQHGFRKAENIQRALEAELLFYSVEVFGTGLTF